MDDKELVQQALDTIKSIETSGRKMVTLAEEMAKRLSSAGNLPLGVEWLSIQAACTRHGNFTYESLKWGLKNNRWDLIEGVHYCVEQKKKYRRILVAYPLIFEAIRENT
jgi:hypothetical protein